LTLADAKAYSTQKYVNDSKSFFLSTQVTPARHINVDNMDTLSVQAKDADGNLFTTLEGLEFDWKIRNHELLQHSRLRETE
jgi:hypothetical protein